MIRTFLYFVFIYVVIACSSQHKERNVKSRIEIISDLPYRTINLSAEIKDELFEIGKLVWVKYHDGDWISELNLIASMNHDDLLKYHLSQDEIESLRQETYDLWKIDDLTWTAIAYKSSSINAQTLAETFFYVIEIEHHKLTGTFYIFIPLGSRDYATDNYTYRERN